MRVVIFLALFAVCKGGSLPTVLPEAVAPSDTFIDPPEAPVDEYGPPTKVALNLAPAPEILSAPAAEPVTTEVVAAAPAQSASFNFLTELTAPPLLPFGVAETSLKAAPAVQQEIVSAPLPEQFQLNIPGLAPPITSIPLPTFIPPVQVLPPTVLPPQTPLPLPLPVQPAPVQPAPLPVQTLAVESNPAPAPVTKITAQEISVPRVQTAFIPQRNYQIILPAAAPLNYAPYYFHTNTFPASLFASRNLLPQLALNAQLATEVLNLQPQVQNPVVATSVVKTAPTLIEAPATSYGTPILETLHKKK